MGKVKEAAVAWPNVAPSNTTYDYNDSLLSTSVDSSSSVDSMLKDLETELFTNLSNVNENVNLSTLTSSQDQSLFSNLEKTDFVSKYISMFESSATNSIGAVSSPQEVIDLVTNEDDTENSPDLNLMMQQSNEACSSDAPLSSPLISEYFSSCTIDSVPMSPQTSPQPFCPSLSPFSSSPSSLTSTLHTFPPSASQLLPTNPPLPSNTLSPLTALSPLSCGGFLFNPMFTFPQHRMNNFIPPNAGSFTRTVNPVAPAIASRQEKLDKYRQKRTKRCLPQKNAHPARRERAQQRTRDAFGCFVPDKDTILVDLDNVKSRLDQSQQESLLLKSQLIKMEQEMAILRQKAEQASASNDIMLNQLAAQQQMNLMMMRGENRLLWPSVPSHEVFCTIKQSNNHLHSKTPSAYLNVKPFQEKIDFSSAVQDLTCTDSSYLEDARNEDNEFIKRWDDMNFIAGGSC